MEVHRDEGLAIRIGPEPCAAGREAGGEASAGERVGQPLSRERTHWSADAVRPAEGETTVSDRRERTVGSAWSEPLACTEVPCAGTGRSLA